VGEPSPLDVVRAYVEACNGDDAEVVIAMLHENVEMHEADVMPAAVHVTGRPAVARYIEKFDTYWSHFEWIPEEFAENGDRVYMRARLRFTGRGSGVDIDRLWRYVFSVCEGKLLSQQAFDDDAEARRAAGLEGDRLMPDARGPGTPPAPR
jgi:ketosteroid isomerase-like protein